eukprot:CAMPEP_0172446478 /NCGR_PEP_ID=MMETSP1065-20121228/6068_1 /TAXON_ID=265537 /ORGANISM="Amphiprora paludosa, Strain CCMP125" /LENGTH=33 /DNA_ID= /DNA_START= /DNA_END= /DNA_ORIENTATION=
MVPFWPAGGGKIRRRQRERMMDLPVQPPLGISP